MRIQYGTQRDNGRGLESTVTQSRQETTNCLPAQNSDMDNLFKWVTVK